MKDKLLFWAITCSLAGFIFGFDLMVISGVEQQIEKLWDLTPAQHGWAISAALWGTVIGALLGGIPTDRLGRKKTLLAIGLLYFISALGSSMANDVTTFALLRMLGGIGVGISTVAAPIFISEISPAARRGRLTGMFQFNIVFGLLIATISNFIIRGAIEVDSWRWMLAVEAIPALIYSVMCLGLPESPRWLIGKSRRAEGKKILAQINPELEDATLENKIIEIEQSEPQPASKPSFDLAKLKLPLMLAFLIAFFNQLSGINAILGFAPRIFGMTGIDTSAGLFNSSLVTLVNLIFTLIGLRLIDKIGRRTLLYIGSFGYIISLAICAWAFSHYKAPFQVAEAALNFKGASELVENPDLSDQKRLRAEEGFKKARLALIDASKDDDFIGNPLIIPTTLSTEENVDLSQSSLKQASAQAGAGSTVVLICILGFIAAHAVGQGAVIWVFISEIFPNRARAIGQSIGCGTHWLFAALLTLVFPIAVAAFSPSALFGFFSVMMTLQLIWVKFMVPETKGVSLEEMDEVLTSK